MIVRLVRAIPLLIVLAVLALVVYLVAGLRYSRPRAKQIILRLFTWLTLAISVVFALGSIYALFERNEAVFELMATFFAVGFLGLAITQICYGVFLKHYPAYRHKAQRARTVSRLRPLWTALRNLAKTLFRKK